jgi:hypothetical protein
MCIGVMVSKIRLGERKLTCACMSRTLTAGGATAARASQNVLFTRSTEDCAVVAAEDRQHERAWYRRQADDAQNAAVPNNL